MSYCVDGDIQRGKNIHNADHNFRGDDTSGSCGIKMMAIIITVMVIIITTKVWVR